MIGDTGTKSKTLIEVSLKGNFPEGVLAVFYGPEENISPFVEICVQDGIAELAISDGSILDVRIYSGGWRLRMDASILRGIVPKIVADIQLKKGVVIDRVFFYNSGKKVDELVYPVPEESPLGPFRAQDD